MGRQVERDREAQIIIKSDGDEVRSRAARCGQLRPRASQEARCTWANSRAKADTSQTLAIGYDPDISFPPKKTAAGQLRREARAVRSYLVVEDNMGCGG